LRGRSPLGRRGRHGVGEAARREFRDARADGAGVQAGRAPGSGSTADPVSKMAGQSHENVVRSASVVSAAGMLSRVTGLVREITFARLFGAGLANDAFVIGFRIPNLTRDLFAEGALSSAFVPTFTAALAREGKQHAAHLSNLVATALILIVGAFCAAGMI